MRKFDMWLDVDTDICRFGESEADAIARNLELIAEEIRSGRLRGDGKFTYVLKNGVTQMSEDSIVGAYKVS